MAEGPTHVAHPSTDGVRRRQVPPQNDVEGDDGSNHFRMPGGDASSTTGLGDEGSSHFAQSDPAPIPEAPPLDDEKQCRICLAGEEEQGELGRLFRPCRCRGSMKFVHVKCLDEWRKVSRSTSASWKCDQCGYQYSFARTKASGLANSSSILGITTATLFLLIVFLSSFVVSYLVPDLDPSHSAAYLEVVAQTSHERNYDWWGRSSAGSAFSDMTKLAVHTFNDVAFGESSDAVSRIVKRLIKGPTLSDAEIARQAAIRRARERKLRVERDRLVPPHPDKNAREQELSSASPPIDPKDASESLKYSPPVPSIWYRIFQRFVLGLSFVGVLSFFNLLISFSLYAPARLMQGGRRLFGTRRGGDRARGGVDLGTVMIFLFVAVGVARVIQKVYQFNRWLARTLLLSAENAILEVQEVDDANFPRPSLWKRLYARINAGIRKVLDIYGDPFEPWYAKISRYILQGFGMVFRRLVNW